MQRIEFKITEEYIELIKLLKAVNIASSGGEAGMIVTEGEVEVNGRTEYRKRRKCRAGDRVLVHDTEIFIHNHPADF